MISHSDELVSAAQPRSVLRHLAQMVEIGMSLALAAGAGYTAICTYVATKLTHPLRQTIPDVATYALPYPCADVTFPSAEDAIPIRGWYIDAGGTRTILMVHGRDGRRDDPSFNMMGVARALLDHGYNVLTIDLRAHGASGGDRYSLGDLERRDVVGALRYLQERGVQAIGAIGFSLGAGTLLRVLPDHPELRALVADSPFAEVVPVVAAHFTEVSHLPRVFMPGILHMTRLLYGMDATGNRPVADVARTGDRPILVIHSADDEYIAVRHAYALQQAAADNPHFQLWITHGPLHVRSYQQDPDTYMRRVLDFFDTNLR